MKLGSPMITTVQGSICSELNNKPRVLLWLQILGYTIPAIFNMASLTKCQ